MTPMSDYRQDYDFHLNVFPLNNRSCNVKKLLIASSNGNVKPILYTCAFKIQDDVI